MPVLLDAPELHWECPNWGMTSALESGDAALHHMRWSDHSTWTRQGAPVLRRVQTKSQASANQRLARRESGEGSDSQGPRAGIGGPEMPRVRFGTSPTDSAQREGVLRRLCKREGCGEAQAERSPVALPEIWHHGRVLQRTPHSARWSLRRMSSRRVGTKVCVHRPRPCDREGSGPPLCVLQLCDRTSSRRSRCDSQSSIVRGEESRGAVR